VLVYDYAHSLGTAPAVPEADWRRVLGELRQLWQGGGDRFGRLMVELSGAKLDYQTARDDYRASGDHAASERAEQARADVAAVYDALAQLYRLWPSLGLADFDEGQGGGLGVLPVIVPILLAVAAVVGSLGLLAWAYSQITQAGTQRQIAQIAKNACASSPSSPACLQALKTVTPPRGWLDQLGDALGALKWPLLALVGLAALREAGAYRRSRSAA
jgi:hypothetical protein